MAKFETVKLGTSEVKSVEEMEGFVFRTRLALSHIKGICKAQQPHLQLAVKNRVQ
jgi:hypothetical protein